jgi:hypothetical protein
MLAFIVAFASAFMPLAKPSPPWTARNQSYARKPRKPASLRQPCSLERKPGKPAGVRKLKAPE